VSPFAQEQKLTRDKEDFVRKSFHARNPLPDESQTTLFAMLIDFGIGFFGRADCPEHAAFRESIRVKLVSFAAPAVPTASLNRPDVMVAIVTAGLKAVFFFSNSAHDFL
jgi:hypothetical protein